MSSEGSILDFFKQIVQVGGGIHLQSFERAAGNRLQVRSRAH